MNILEKIAAHKRKEVDKSKSLVPVKLLQQSIYFNTTPLSLKGYIKKPGLSGVIAEIKRKSPSQEDINFHIDIEETSLGYMQAGASALSILTDTSFFGGTNTDLIQARTFNFCPILRKDFIVDHYQIVEGKSIGADAILLIAAMLSTQQTAELARQAKDLGLEVLLEVHNEKELDYLNDDIDIVGVNNRNLKSFEIDLDISDRLVNIIPNQYIKISESGINSPEECASLRAIGYDGFLIGTQFMQQAVPHLACAEFIKKLNKIEAEK